MLESRSPKRIYYTILATGVLMGMALDQLIWKAAGMLETPIAMGTVPALLAISLGTIGWRMVASLPWGTINDPARYEYRNPYGPSGTVGDGGEKDSGTSPSGSPEA